MSECLYVYAPTYVSTCLSTYLPTYYLFVCLTLCLSTLLLFSSLCLSCSLLSYLFTCLHVCLPFYYLPACLLIFIIVYLFISFPLPLPPVFVYLTSVYLSLCLLFYHIPFNQSVCSSLCLQVCPPTYSRNCIAVYFTVSVDLLSLHMFVYHHTYSFFSASSSTFLYICLSTLLPIHLSVCSHVCMYVCLSDLSIPLACCLPSYLFTCLPVYSLATLPASMNACPVIDQ